MKISRGQAMAIGTLIALVGIVILSSQYLLEKKNTLFDILNMQMYFNQLEEPVPPEQNPELEQPQEPEPEPEPEKPSEPVITESYVAVLEIPKIELRKGIYQIGSRYNTVNRNVAILSPSDYPDVNGGNFVLAAHSGNGYLSFFRNLYKLATGDYAYIYYNNNKYTYKITYIYYQPKTGTINVYRPYGKTTLMMITCTKDDESSQTVYVAELESVEATE
ncbi:MAG: sortase [Bacilli bacterium]|nr:sortase [Bacilli bacterium]